MRRAYLGLAVFLFNCFVLAGIMNLGAAAGLALFPWESAPPVDLHPLAVAYPDMPPGELAQLARESVRTKRYEPFTESTEPVGSGRFVSVDVGGYRRSRDQAPWPPADDRPTVFVFGGSTTFGYGIRDEDTVPSFLQALLRQQGVPVAVYNFGRGGYYSTQERMLFQSLATQGRVPKVAVFIDGLNDFYAVDDYPSLVPALAAHVARKGLPEKPPLVSALRSLPAVELLRRVRGMLVGRPLEVMTIEDPWWSDDDPVMLDRVIERYETTKRLTEAMAAALGVRTVFVWQPVPMYEYDVRYQATPFKPGHRHVAPGYEAMARAAAGGRFGRNFIWCASIQRGLAEPLYVDSCHYSPPLAERLARCIVTAALERELLGDL